jgi:type IV fimbrial biogenesis protein FimT
MVEIMMNESGFTLVELLVTMVVATILLAVAVPTYNDFIQNSRVTANSNNLVNALAIARSEAIRRREPVTVCSSTDLLACSLSSNWETGWIIFNDRNTNGTIDGLSDQLLRVWEAVPFGHAITATGGANQIQFDRLGATDTAEVFRLSNPGCKAGQANRERIITLISSGSVIVQRSDCS